jgi:hypothetical protein
MAREFKCPLAIQLQLSRLAAAEFEKKYAELEKLLLEAAEIIQGFVEKEEGRS